MLRTSSKQGHELEEEKGKIEPEGAEGEEKVEEGEEEIVSNWEDKVESFDELGLKEELLRGIYGYGFTKPSPIQQKGILPLLKKHDTIAQVKVVIISRHNQEQERPPHSLFPHYS